MLRLRIRVGRCVLLGLLRVVHAEEAAPARGPHGHLGRGGRRRGPHAEEAMRVARGGWRVRGAREGGERVRVARGVERVRARDALGGARLGGGRRGDAGRGGGGDDDMEAVGVAGGLGGHGGHGGEKKKRGRVVEVCGSCGEWFALREAAEARWLAWLAGDAETHAASTRLYRKRQTRSRTAIVPSIICSLPAR